MLKRNSINVHCKFGARQKWEPAGRIGDSGNFLNGFAKIPRLIVLNIDWVPIVLNKKTPEGAYAGCIDVRKNYRYVGWQWKVEYCMQQIGNLRSSTTVEWLRLDEQERSMVDWIEYEPFGARKREIKIVNRQAATAESLIDGHRVINVISWTSWSLCLPPLSIFALLV